VYDLRSPSDINTDDYSLSKAKQLQIDDLLSKLNNASGDLDCLREEKDREIMILQEGMDSTIQQLSDAQQVKAYPPPLDVILTISIEPRYRG
jgi:hypothetical protein